MKLVSVVTSPEAAKLISDPMRRAILNLLRRKALSEAELAEQLGLTDATVNYHLGLLRKAGLLYVARRRAEGHGIIQKFYAPSAFLYLPDVEALPKEAARYYYPVNIERMRGVLSAGSRSATWTSAYGGDVDRMGEEFAKELVGVARRYEGRDVSQGEGEDLVNLIYAEALIRLTRKGESTPRENAFRRGKSAE